MRRKFSHIFAHLFFVALIFAVCCGEVSAAAAGTQPPLKLPRSTSEAAGSESGILHGQREKQADNWVFDFSQDPNFENLLEAETLESAVLTLNLHPDELEISSPELAGDPSLSGGDNAEQPSLSIKTTAKIEVDLLDIYSAEDLLKLFNEQAGKLPISYHDPDKISSVELQLVTEKTEHFPVSMLLVFSVILLVLTYLRYTARKKESPTQQASSDRAHHTRLAAVGEQTSTVIHDVKNSFAAIRGCAEIIADDSLTTEERKEFAEMIVGEIDRGVYMTQELLEFSRGRKPVLRLQTVFLHELLEQTLTVLRQDLQEHHIRLHIDIQKTGALQLDPEKMRRVFMNLITNAKEAMPDGGTLTLRSYRHNGQIIVEFVDDGCGMPPEVAERIFEPFMTRGKASGTGLGMAIVKDIIDAHQATIEVQSVENRGTSFRIFLPEKRIS